MCEYRISVPKFVDSPVYGGLAQMVERSLSMREVPGSIPGISSFFYFYCNRKITRVLIILQSMAHHSFRRASDTLLMNVNQESSGRFPHRQRSQLIPDVTVQAATIAKKIGKGE